MESTIRAVLLLAIALAAQYMLSDRGGAHRLFANLMTSTTTPPPPPEGKHISVAKTEKEVNQQQAQSVCLLPTSTRNAYGCTHHCMYRVGQCITANVC